MSNPLKDLKLSSEELKAIAKIRGIKGYKSMFEDEILSVLTSSKPVKKDKKPKTIFFKARERSGENLMNRDINFLN